MIKRTLATLVASFFMVLTTQIVLADDHDNIPSNAVKISAVIQNIQAKGYQNIHEVEFDDGVYKAKAINSDGKEVKLYIDPQKNEITKVITGWTMKANNKPAKFSMLDAIKKVEAAGYRDIYEIDIEHDTYEMKAFDKDGKKIELKVNINTGNISKQWFD